jgi:hypothetical protein
MHHFPSFFRFLAVLYCHKVCLPYMKTTFLKLLRLLVLHTAFKLSRILYKLPL